MPRKTKFKMLTVLLLAVLLLSMLCGCSRNNVPEKSSKLRIVTTIFPQYDFARQIAGDRAEVYMLLKPGEEVHSYEPTPKDIRLIQSADLFIYVGGENDVWVENILDSMGDKKPKTLRLVDMVDTRAEESSEGMQEPKGEEEEEEAPDEHVWTSPVNAIAITSQICDAMCEYDSDNASIYRNNSAAYIEELKEIDAEFRDIVKNAKRKTIVFGDRFPLLYFVKEYGLDYYAAFLGCSADNEVSAGTLAYLTKKVKALDIPVVFKIELSSDKIASAICEVTGSEILTFYSCHNVTAKQFESGISYTDLMRENAISLREALN